MVGEGLERAKDDGKPFDRENRKRAGELVMINNKNKGFIKIQLFGDNPEGAETPTNTQDVAIDYEQEYKKVMAQLKDKDLEIEKQKGLKDKYAEENANYKRQAQEKMSDEEKKAQDLKELIDSKNKIEAELKQMKLEKEILANGFTKDECDKLINGNFSIKDIADIMKARVDDNTKSIKATLIKDSTPNTPMNDTTNGSQKSDFAKHQESVLAKTTTGRVEL